jgi:glycosyltransferase involved in cell wall biosynthesis
MRICMVTSTNFPPEEGIGYHVYNISKRLIERGHEVTVVTRGKLGFTEKDCFDGIQILRPTYAPVYPFHVALHGFFANRVFEQIENEFDIVHIHTPLSPTLKTHLPMISTIHTSQTEDARHTEVVNLRAHLYCIQTRYISFPLIRKLINASSMVTTVSNSVVQELEKDYKFSDAVIVGNGVDERKFHPIKTKGDSNYILYVGRLGYRKGIFELLKAIKNVLDHYDIKLLLVGKGELEPLLREYVRSNNLDGNVQFLGHVGRDRLVRLYQEARIFVMPSIYESGPLTLLEAMSCGRPVIATSTGISPEVIKHGYNGLLIPSSNATLIQSAIEEVMQDESFGNFMGTNARKTIEDNYSWDRVTDRVEKCYMKVNDRNACR